MRDLVEGIVIEANAEIAKVKLNRHNSCSSCGLCRGADAEVLDVQNILDTKPGQRVILEFKEVNMLKAAVIIFALPLIAIMAGLLLGYYFSLVFEISIILSMTIGAVFFGLLAVLVIKHFDKFLQSSAADMTKIVKLIR
jgi:sigma-E factor negative regulatory protein RseC